MKLSRTLCSALAFTLSLSLIGSLLAPAAASAEESEWGVTAQAESLPRKFDLRERGVVTPVKRQNPWSTCWSFGAIAAAESSILSDMGKTYADTGFDLSEKHVIYFSMNPITEAQSGFQYDEGLYHLGAEGDTNAAYRTANSIVASTLFSTGVGPLLESSFPYQNNAGLTEYEYMQKHPDEWKELVKAEVERKNDMTLAELIKKNSANPNYAKTEAQYLQNCWNNYIDTVKENDYYSDYLDWSLEYSQRDQSNGFVLIDGNALPEYVERNANGKWAGLSQHAVEATKKELLKGRAVSVSFCADSSSPGQSSANGKYIELNNWAHYTYDNVQSNHRVAIVGWDDDYSRENFLSGTDANGSSKTPPANGAWIVKNSWGSETDAASNANGRPISKGTWGIKNAEGKSTGYFYLSYYDKSISRPESLKFGTDLSEGDYFSIYQYDYLPADDGFYFATSDGRVSTANVFTVDPNGDEVLTSIGLRTYAENTTVENEVYKLPEGVTNPEKGEKVASFVKAFEYGGFHRVALPKPVKLDPGSRFSIVSTGYVKRSDGTLNYGLAANKADSQAYAQKKINAGERNWVYGKSVINKGESYLYWKDGWYDWRECIDNGLNVGGLKAQSESAGEMEPQSESAGELEAQSEAASINVVEPQSEATDASVQDPQSEGENGSAVEAPVEAQGEDTEAATQIDDEDANEAPEQSESVVEDAEDAEEKALEADEDVAADGLGEGAGVEEAAEADAANGLVAQSEMIDVGEDVAEGDQMRAAGEANAETEGMDTQPEIAQADEAESPAEEMATIEAESQSEAMETTETESPAEETGAAAVTPQADEPATAPAEQPVTSEQEMTDGLVAQAESTQASEADRYPSTIEKGDSVVDNFTLKAYTIPASAYTEGKTKTDPAPVGEMLSDEYSLKDKGAKVGAGETWPEDGFTDDAWENAGESSRDPGLPGMSKDFYDESWDGKDPNAVEEAAPQDQGAQSSGQSTQNTQTSKPAAQAPAAQTTSQQRQSTTTASTSKATPNTGDDSDAPLMSLALVGACALAWGFSRRCRAED
ncbi:MAG: hypothetical protein IKF14_03505 [Atopobiaceae bacterium]|nr:hypothetical protein [Atopobiaceae bacterium]